ncbi:hypothetical protein BG004_000699 [Podila humilis]|nr:hypothetical protein BG004_000699 [Podila humilis]
MDGKLGIDLPNPSVLSRARSMYSRKNDICNDKHNEDSIENSESDGSTGNNAILSTSKEGRLWFLNKLARKEDIGMPEFCNEFGYTCEQDAHAAFSRLLSDSQLPLSSRAAVDTKYKSWQRNEGEGFWACLTTDYRIDISTTKTVEDLVDRGQFFTSRLLRSRPRDDPKNDESSGHTAARNASLSSSGIIEFQKRKLPTMDGGSLSGDRDEEATIVNSPVRSLCHTIDEGSYPSTPEDSSCSPPSPLDFNKTAEEEAQTFFSAAGSLQDILFSSLQDGCSLPAWAKDRPLHQFKLRLREEWGPRVTGLYESAERKALLDHTHVDEIALLSGIVHLNKRHIGFSEQEIKTITASVLEMFYSQEMKEEGIQRAQEAVLLWASWVQKWKRLLVNEKVAAQRENRDPVEAIDTEPVVEAIFSSYAECKDKKITPILFIALHVFRQYNSWATLVSESDCLMGVVGPILKEVMAVQHEIKFTCANACTSVGKTRKAQLQQDGQSRQPDVIGLTEAKEEIFYGELKGPTPKTAAVNTDVPRLAVFSKGSLDQVHNIVVEGPPLLTFQTVGRDVTFFLAAKVDNTVVHLHLSTVKLPAHLKDMDLEYEFFNLFQVQTLIKVARDRLGQRREVPSQDVFFPTLGTPERKAAMKNSISTRE